MLLKFSLSIFTLFIITALIAFITLFVPKLMYSPKGNYTVAMAGRSVMEMWFRYWNLPQPLNNISVYKKWPIPYHKFQHDGIYLEYISVASPHKNINKPDVKYGQELFRTLFEQLDDKKIDSLFFKFCFVDFGDKSLVTDDQTQARFEDMISLVKKVHDFAEKKHMKLLLANSLPVLRPGKYGQELRYMFNKWVDSYVLENNNIIKVDLFGILTDKNGCLQPEYSLDIEDLDSHPNMKAFKLLEEELFSKLKKIQ